MRITHGKLGRLIRDGIAVMALGLFALTLVPAHAEDEGPFEKFFKRVRHAMQADAKPRTHRVSQHRTTREEPGEGPARHVQSAPNERNTRTTRAAQSGKKDLPYATPVPGKKGFVTSPFSPDGGYIDVRDFPPGTEVKDPYSGKTFLTP